MTKEQGFLWLAEALMLFALGCFVRGFLWRKRDLERHMRLGKLGAITVFGGILVLELLMRIAGWRFPVRDTGALRWHIGIASVAFVLLVALVYTGMRRLRGAHTRLYLLFFPAYVLTILFSLLAFDFGV